MTTGELAIVIGAVLVAISFAAVVVTLVRVRDTLAEVRDETGRLVEELRRSTSDAASVIEAARDDLERFDRVLGSAEAISGAVARSSNRLKRAALSRPMIRAAGIATGTSQAVRRLRSGT